MIVTALKQLFFQLSERSQKEFHVLQNVSSDTSNKHCDIPTFDVHLRICNQQQFADKIPQILKKVINWEKYYKLLILDQYDLHQNNLFFYFLKGTKKIFACFKTFSGALETNLVTLCLVGKSCIITIFAIQIHQNNNF